MAADGEKRYKAKRMATETDNLRRVTVTIGRSQSDSVRGRTTKKDPKHYDVLEDAEDMVCCTLHVTYCKLRVEC